jgi:crotonobetainyl-CoA:carnitine CoA-transferase CaiB-like acyl-CoA transferase
VRDPHYIERRMWEEVDLGGGETVKMPAMVPRLSKTPGGTAWSGPALGAHNEEIFRGLLGMDEAELQALAAEGVI